MENYLAAYNTFLAVMAFIALCVFVALHFFEAGYGYLFDRRYGPPVPNKVGWVLMESPVFVMMWALWALSDRMWDAVPLTLLAMFQLHYFQRSFIFPLLMRGRSKMPLGIVLMGMVFNTLNALMQGGWIFYFAPEGYYDGWFCKPFIYVGALLCRHVHQPAVGLYHTPPAQGGRHAPLYSPRRHVPICFVGQLFR